MRRLLVLLSACSAISFGADAPPATSSTLPANTTVVPKVTDEQRAKAREANEKFRTEQTALLDKLRTTRREMEKAVGAEVIDENAIRSKAATLGQIEGELAVLRAKHAKELRAILPHESAAGTNQTTQRLQSIVRRDTNNPAIKPRPVNTQ